MLFRLGLASKPWVWLSQTPDQAKAVNQALALAWLGLAWAVAVVCKINPPTSLLSTLCISDVTDDQQLKNTMGGGTHTYPGQTHM